MHEMVVSLPAATLKHDCALSVVLIERKNANRLSCKIFFIAVKLAGFVPMKIINIFQTLSAPAKRLLTY